LSEAGKGNCLGKALPELEFKIIKPVDGPLSYLDQATLLPEGEIGEIIIRGPIVTESYDELPEATAAAKIVSEVGLWHRIGDMGYIDAKQRLWFCGRKSHRVIVADKVWYSVCCEAIFNAHPKVFRTALISAPSGTGPALAVELLPKARITKQTLLKELQSLAQSSELTQAIEDFYLHPAFPVDVRHNAKIHREELSQWAKTAKSLSL